MAKRSIRVKRAISSVILGTTVLPALLQGRAAAATPVWVVSGDSTGTELTTTTDGTLITASCDSGQATTATVVSRTPGGATNWTTNITTGDAVPCSPPEVVADAAGNVYVIDEPMMASLTATGALRWSAPIDGHMWRGLPPSIGANGDLYVPRSGGVYVYKTADGASAGAIFASDVTGLATYATGVVVVDSSQQIKYYDYAGNLQHSYTVPATLKSYEAYDAAGGAAGAMFVSGYGPTCGANLSVAKYQPSGLAWTWTDTSTTACAQTWLTALPNGGAVLTVRQDGDGRWIGISPSGQTAWTYQAVGPAANAYASNVLRAAADTSGNVLLPAEYAQGCDVGSTWGTCYGVEITPVGEATGLAVADTATYIDSVGGGYFPYDARALPGFGVVGANGNGDTLDALIGMPVSGLGADYRAILASPAAPSPPPKRYAALGDSYSAGEGLSPYLAGTNQTSPSKDLCHRSSRAYGPLLDTRDALGTLTFVACSGAVTADVFKTNHSNPTEKAQVTRIPASATTVTLTIGGNDVGFAKVLDSCIRMRPFRLHGYGCSKNSAVTGPVKARLDALKGVGSASTPAHTAVYSILSVLRRIHTQAPKARIYIAGYPHLFGSAKSSFTKAKSAPSGYVCEVYRKTPLVASIDYADAQWMNQKADALDAAIASGAQAAVKAGLPVTYVSAVESSFSHHGLCDTSTAWIYKLYLNSYHGSQPWSFHPTATGQASAYEHAFLAAPGL